MLGNPMSKHGAIFLAKDIEGAIQANIDIIKTTLQANCIVVTPKIEDEISLYFKTQQEEYDRKQFAKGIPEKLQTLLSYTKKSKLVAYCRRIIISEEELFLLIHNCHLLGYSHRSKFLEYVPENRRLTDSDRTLLVKTKPKKFISKIRAIFKERKNYMIHLFESTEKWHCIYYTYKDMEPVSWKHGPHLHFVSYLWTEYGKRQVWESFDKRQHKIEGIHIRLEPLPEYKSEGNQEFKALAQALIDKYKKS
ncbi:hypothetical protein ACFLYE_01880 [Chloroflexota bacterium]